MASKASSGVVGALRAAIGRPAAPQLDILDLRHLSSAQLRPLLEDESAGWEQRLSWNYVSARELLLQYVDNRVLPGFAAIDHGRVVGYAFGVQEAEKAIVGDVFAFGEGGDRPSPLCNTLLLHLLELLEATPGTDRIEAQLLMFDQGTVGSPFGARGFRTFPRLFMHGALQPEPSKTTVPADLILEPWHPALFGQASELIHRAYRGHVDSGINDQYQTVAGSQRFLNNIVRFPGCGEFLPEHSLALRRRNSDRLEGLLMCSAVRSDTAHVTQLCVDSQWRGAGLGELLLRRVSRQLLAAGFRQLSLTVTEQNTGAVRLYERVGLSTRHRFDAYAWQAQSSL